MISWYALAIASAVLLACARVIEKKVLFSEHAIEFSTSTGIQRIILLLLLIPFVDFSMITFPGIMFIYFTSLVASFAFLYRSKATRRMNISEIEPLFNLQPIFLLLLGLFLLGEHPSSLQVGGVFILILGTYLLEITEDSRDLIGPIKRFFSSKHMAYLFFAILALTFMAIFDKVIITEITAGNPLTYLFLVYIFIGINFIIIDLVRYGKRNIITSLKANPFFVFLAMILHTGNIFLYYTSLSLPGVMVTLVTPIRRTSSFFSTVIGGSMLHEDHILLKATASIIMIIGAVGIIIG